MTNEAAVLALFLVYLIWRFGIRRALIDIFRTKLFSIRDDLFERARSGKISFDEPAYCKARSLINGLIMMSRDVGTVKMLRTMFAPPTVEYEDGDPVPFHPQTRGLVERAVLAMVVFVPLISPPLVVIVVGWVLAYALTEKSQRAMYALARTVMVSDQVSNGAGQPSTETIHAVVS